MILAELLLGCKLWKNKNEISVIRDRLRLLKENPDQSGAEQIAKNLSLTSHFEELDPLLLKVLKKTTRSRFENTYSYDYIPWWKFFYEKYFKF